MTSNSSKFFCALSEHLNCSLVRLLTFRKTFSLYNLVSLIYMFLLLWVSLKLICLLCAFAFSVHLKFLLSLCVFQCCSLYVFVGVMSAPQSITTWGKNPVVCEQGGWQCQLHAYMIIVSSLTFWKQECLSKTAALHSHHTYYVAGFLFIQQVQFHVFHPPLNRSVVQCVEHKEYTCRMMAC